MKLPLIIIQILAQFVLAEDTKTLQVTTQTKFFQVLEFPLVFQDFSIN